MEILITFILVSLGWYLYHKNIIHKLSKESEALSHDLNNQTIYRDYEINHKVSEKIEELNNQILELRRQLIDIEKESYEKGKKQAEENFANDYVIQVQPYRRFFKEKHSLLGSLKEKEKVEIGYQYRLFVKGAPSLEPAVIVVETYESKEFKLNEDAIKTLINSVIGDKTEIAGSIIKIANNIIEKK